MTIRNPKRFGLEVNRHLADVKNSTIALGSLGISPLDLEVIHNSTNASPPVDYDDWRSLSRLKQPLFKILDRYNQDASRYNSILDKRAGTSGSLFGNLNVNGRLSGNAIRYRYVKGSGNSATAEIADISTSRVSAWSSTVPEPIPDTAQISYGARIGIKASRSGDGGRSKIKFNTQRGAGLATGTRLKTTLVPQKVEFESEIPTSKVKIRLGGSDVWVYAMKGIPVSFRGFFRNLYGAWISVATIDAGSGPVQPSWKIVRPDNRNDYSNFRNTTSVTYYSVRSRERDIEIYYPPDSITQLKITSANIQELPVVKFSTLTYLDMSSNDIRTFPSLAGTGGIAPILTSLHFNNNPLYLSENANERKFNQAFIDKIPTTLQTLGLSGCFYGTISGSGSSSVEKSSLIAKRFPNLTTFNIGRGGGAYFHPDNDDPEGAGNCSLPNVGVKVEYYNAQGSDFRRFANGDTASGWYNVKSLPDLKQLELYGNYNLSDNINLATAGFDSNKLNYINHGNTGMPMINCNGLSVLENYIAQYLRNSGSFFTNSSGTPAVYTGYKFAGCDSLKQINLYASGGLNGPFPKFNHPQMTYLELTYTNIQGGGPNGALASDANFVIPRDTFENATSLQSIYILSSALKALPIHEEAFSFCPNLRDIRLISNGNITGNLPDLSNLSQLHWFDWKNNAFTGNIPSFSTNPNIGYVYLDDNRLSGTIPALKNLASLDYLYLHNQLKSGNTGFTAISTFENMPRLRRFYVHNNNIEGEIPDFTECPRMEYLTLFSNKFTSYKADSFKSLYYIRYIDVSNNNLTQQAINKIVDDLYENYEVYPRGRVTINMRDNYAFGNQNALVLPSLDQLDKIDVLKNAGWTFLIGT